MKQGQDGFIYFLTTGSRASWGTANAGIVSGTAPTNLSAVGGVVDVKIGMEKTKADGSKRGGKGWKATVGTLRAGNVGFKARYDLTDAGQLAMLKAFMQSGVVFPAVALDTDKATVGAFGLWADFEVVKMEKTEDLEGIQEWDIELEPSAYSNIAPEWVTVSA